MATKAKFYAVAVGRTPGIYREWYGPDGAEAQVTGFSGARFQGFPSQAAARAWLAQQGIASPALAERPAPASRPAKDPAGRSKKHGAANHGGNLGDAKVLVPELVSTALAAGQVVIFTDGACTGNPGRGGWAAVLRFGEHRKEISGGFARTTNNRMELTACIEALRLLQRPSKVTLFSDSRYVVQGIEKGWAKRWRANHWMRNADEAAENPDLWAELLQLSEKHQLRLIWLRGHAGHAENERCDQLAVAAAHLPTLPPDPGYKK